MHEISPIQDDISYNPQLISTSSIETINITSQPFKYAIVNDIPLTELPLNSSLGVRVMTYNVNSVGNLIAYYITSQEIGVVYIVKTPLQNLNVCVF